MKTPRSRTTNQALKAHGVMQQQSRIDYVVKDSEIIIVDEFTGRLMLGRRYSKGAASGHRGQGARGRAEGEQVLTITFQNYFRLCKLSDDPHGAH